MSRPTIYEYAGGEPAFQALAAALHERCLRDPVLNHPFSHADRNPDHVERLGLYLAEVFGGPPRYTRECATQTFMIDLHAGNGMEDDLGQRFLTCYLQAIDDAGLPDDPEFRAALRSYMEHAVADVLVYNTPDAVVPEGLTVPQWTWASR